jgi:precorrin-2 C20-methyltransferase/precorrin-3B C17-methyltransferase
VTGRVTVVGLGPGPDDWRTPAVTALLEGATDLVGYGPYLDRVAPTVPGRRHRSGNRVEANRAQLALDLGAAGGDVVVVSSGDPGVFAMASAVLEQLELHPDRWHDVQVEIQPGITAALAAASRVGAPLGHDFCVISLSDVRKPWAVIERRLDAAGAADFVVALYNTRSRHRPDQLAEALSVLARHRTPSTPVVVARRVGAPEETVEVVTLGTVDIDAVDMSTVVLVGSSQTRVLDRPRASSVYTPRSYEDAPARA